MGRPNMALTISPSERSQLLSILRSRSLPHSLVQRAQIVLLSAEGVADRAAARRCGVSAPGGLCGVGKAALPGLHTNFVWVYRVAGESGSL
jgi:hypothetical protein